MKRVGEHPVTAGPLALRWLAWSLEPARAGVTGSGARRARERGHGDVALARARTGVQARLPLARPARQPDRLGRPPHAAPARRSRPARRSSSTFRSRRRARRAATGSRSTSSRSTGSGSRRSVRRRSTSRSRSRRGSPSGGCRSVVHGGPDAETTAALAGQEEPLVEHDAVAVAHLVAGALPAPDWSRLLLDAHAEGWAAVGGAVAPEARRDRGTFAPWAPARPQPALRPPAAPSVAARRGRARRSISACRPTTGPAGCSTAGSWSDFRGDPVVDRREHEGAEPERDDRRDDEVDEVGRAAALDRRRAAPGSTRRRRQRSCPTGSGRSSHGCVSAPGSPSRL